MPEAWSRKDERMYDRIKRQQLADGKSNEEAERVAAATVNKRRSEQGRTKQQRRG